MSKSSSAFGVPGLVRREEGTLLPRCQLYADFFEEYFNRLNVVFQQLLDGTLRRDQGGSVYTVGGTVQDGDGQRWRAMSYVWLWARTVGAWAAG